MEIIYCCLRLTAKVYKRIYHYIFKDFCTLFVRFYFKSLGIQIGSNVSFYGVPFVSLHKEGELRGCIGRLDATEPLYEIIKEMAISAAVNDSRFPEVDEDELDSIEIEISGLTPMKKIDNIDQIELGRHGIFLRKGIFTGTFLPQVATETGWSKEEFLGYCAKHKACIGWEGWKNAEIYTYDAIIFSEKNI